MEYSIIGILAILINFIINRDVLQVSNKSTESAVEKAYRLFNYAILSYHVTDVLWGICEASGNRVLLYSDTVVYFIAMYVAVMLWARYVITYLDDHSTFSKALMTIAYVLFALQIVTLIINHFVHIFFWVDESCVYHAYTFRYIALFIQIVLFLITSGYAFIKQKRTGSESIKRRYRMFGMFGIIMSAAILLQVLYPLMPIYSIGYMLGICLIHTYIIEDENDELRKKADAANLAKTKFLFNMSHDIRTPMNAILGYTDISLSHTDNPNTVKDNLGKIKTSGVHLLHLINDVLEMSRIESDKLVIQPEPITIRDALDDIVKISQPLATHKQIDFQVSFKDIRNAYIYADKLHADEVVINLLSNAFKFTPEGGTVKYYAEQISDVIDGKATYRFTVSDNGIGMSEEFQQHLFETFSREKSSTVSQTEGTGLGLSIVKRIVDLSGGIIRFESKQNAGTTFVIEIPFQVMDDNEIKAFIAAGEKNSDVGAEDISLENTRVLLVEDNEMNREIITEMLTEAGLIVEPAVNGERAVKAILEKGPQYYDLVLMDIQMPVMDGYEATRTIRHLPGGERIPIIAVSANAFDEDIRKSKENGMNEHIAKPINIKTLLDAIRRYKK